MPAILSLKCLGIPRLTTASGREIPFKVRKHMALLVYLAVEDQAPHRRDHLVEVFWPGVSSRLGRQSLATAVSAIRRRVGRPEVIESLPEHVRIMPGHLALDLDRLLEGRVVSEDWEPTIEVAGFLEGFELPGLGEFEHWRDRQQARLLPAIQRGLVTLADLARRSGDVGELGRLANRLLAINELSEEGVRARMEAAAMSGDRVTALKTFDRYVEQLRSELEARPSSLLEGMAIRLRRRGWDRPLDSSVPSVHTEHWRNRDFVGRAREYRALYAVWEQVRVAKAGHMLITGPSGVGKTTLADRFVTAAGLEGAQAARARGYEIERGIPFAMIGTVIRELLDRPGAAATSPASLAELARIVPEVTARFHGLPPVPEALGESARIRFVEAVYEFVLAVTAEQPLVLLVDDFHQVDEASLAALHYVMRRAADQPLMVLLTTPDAQAGEAPTGVRIRETASQLALTSLEVGPMSAEESAQLLDALVQRAPRAPTAVERNALLKAAGGFPLALELLFSAWQDHGHDLSFLSLDTMTVGVGRGPEETYRRLADSSIRQLAPGQLVVLQLAAVLDRRLGEFSMYRLVDLPPTQVVGEMMGLSARRILRDTGHRMEFVNPALRAHAYLAIPGALRQVLHSGVADALLGRHAGGERIPGLEIAWHCVRAGRVAEGRPFILSGAREALDQGAPHEVELALKTGMSVLEADEQVTATLLLAEALGEIGRWGEALETLASRFPSEGDQAVEFQALALLCRARLVDANITAIEEIHREATAILNGEGPAAAKVHAAAAGSLACAGLRDPRASAAMRQALEPLLDIAYEVPKKTHVLTSLATVCAYEGLGERALELALEATAIARSHGLRSTVRVRAENGVGVALCSLGRYDEAISYISEAISILQAIGNETFLRFTRNNLALCHFRLGDYSDQLKAAEAALRLSDRSADPQVLFTYYHAAIASCFLGLREQARHFIECALAAFSDAQVGWVWQRALFTAADVFWLLGNPGRAQTYAKKAIGIARPRLLAPQLAGPFSRWVGVLAPLGKVTPQAWPEVEEANRQGHTLDLVDRFEVLASLALHRGLTGEEAAELRRIGGRLPPATLAQLEALGLRV